jgi:alkylation response protein AidB-like acyl-CoA dehydrogenase
LIVFTAEQNMLRDSLAAWLQDNYSFEDRRSILAGEDGWSAPLCDGLATDLGLTALALPASAGGLDGGYAELMIVAEEFGRVLMSEPVLESLVIGAGLARRLQTPAVTALSEQLAAGQARLAFAFAEPQARYVWRDLMTVAVRASGGGFALSGHKAVVIGAAAATHFVVSARTGGAQWDPAGISLFLVPAAAPGISRRDYRTIDGRIASEVYLEGVTVGVDALLGPQDQGLLLLEGLIDDATAAVCAEACGVLRRIDEDTVEYCKQRRQFGNPLAGFQVLQHRLVDMFIHVERTQSLTMLATHILAEETDPAARARMVSAAKAHVGAACRFVGQNAIQLHGAMGITDELAVGHYFKRSTMIESQFGSTDHHLARYESLTFGPA